MTFLNVRSIETQTPVSLAIQDDSFFPFYGGGSKARKLTYFLQKAENESCNAIVTAGASNSNHAKVVALACAEKGWECTIVVHDKEDYTKGNLLLMKLAGAKLIFCSLDEVAPLMDKEMGRFREQRLKPYYIYGGGHGLPGYLAFYEAAKSYVQSQPDLLPDYVVHASGTGGTQAGLIVGFNEFLPEAKVIGVSVARDQGRGASVIRESCNELTSYLDVPSVPDEKICFRDDWVGAGYGSIYPELLNTIKNFSASYGLITDPTYTGKALHGLTVMIDRGDIPRGSKVLFWHTGGLINLFEHTQALLT